jgi:hypothetical protein
MELLAPKVLTLSWVAELLDALRRLAARAALGLERLWEPTHDNEASRDSGGPLCDRTSVRPRLPHFVGETKTPPSSPLVPL